MIKNIKSWCKLIIPSITGEAASWKYICHGVEESSKKKDFWGGFIFHETDPKVLSRDSMKIIIGNITTKSYSFNFLNTYDRCT